jgi:hypothetical protein
MKLVLASIVLILIQILISSCAQPESKREVLPPITPEFVVEPEPTPYPALFVKALVSKNNCWVREFPMIGGANKISLAKKGSIVLVKILDDKFVKVFTARADGFMSIKCIKFTTK